MRLMKPNFFLAPLLALAGCVFHPVGNAAVPMPAKPVDVTQYLGKWYEVARYDQWFERGCTSATATYTLRPDGMLGITNACVKADGTAQVAQARGKIVPDSGNARLKVSFFGPFFIGNYWVMDHAEDYSWTIVGEPTGRFLWLLDRRDNLTEDEVKAFYARAAALGYDTSLLLRG